MLDADLLALNCYEEAAGEPDDGIAAVAHVVKNRMALKFFSDGTVTGTVLAKDQFSWAYFGFVQKPSGTFAPCKHTASEEYVRLNHTVTEAQAMAEKLFGSAIPGVLAHCGDLASQVMSGTYYSPDFAKLGNDAVSYCNPDILTKQPSWAIPSKLLVRIGRHDFYRA